jgi:hypothetical protein
MAGGKGKIRPEDGKQFSKEYQPEEKWTEQKALELGKDLINWLKAKDADGEDKGNMFYEEYLVIERDFYLDLIRYLSNKFTSFSELIEKAKKIQEIKLVKYGVGDRLNATMTKFTLTNNHGWSDQTKTVNENINHNIELTPERAKEVKKIFDADY